MRSSKNVDNEMHTQIKLAMHNALQICKEQGNKLMHIKMEIYKILMKIQKTISFSFEKLTISFFKNALFSVLQIKSWLNELSFVANISQSFLKNIKIKIFIVHWAIPWWQSSRHRNFSSRFYNTFAKPSCEDSL